jgi:hypothetical protein
VLTGCIGFLAQAQVPALKQAHGFSEPPPEAYLDPVDRQIARTRMGVPGRPVPCARHEKQNGVDVIVGVPTERCFKMHAPQRWSGLWRNDFEGSQFCPRPARTCDHRSEGERIWLTEKPDRRGDGKLYRVEFVGRKTIYKGAYGHMGASDHEIVVERMIRLREVSKQQPR